MLAVRTQTRARRRYQQEVERLLEQIQRQVQELRWLRTGGASRTALADRKRRLEQTRSQLASLVSAATPRTVSYP
jgi:F0F1-type ATP synthase membrane subunit b/b'